MRTRTWRVYQYANGYFVEEVGRRATRMFGPFVGDRALEEFLAQRRAATERN